MNRYKEEVDALHASDALKESIASLPQQTPKKKPNTRRFGTLAAVLVVILVAGIVGVPSVFLATRRAGADKAAAQDSKSSFYTPVGGGMGGPEEDGYAYENAAASTADNTVRVNLPANRKLIRNATLNVETREYDAFLSSVQTRLTALGGYVQSTETGSNYDGTSRYATLVFRVPADKLDDFLTHVGEVGNVTSQSTSVQDVTDDYIDIESRVKALETEQETLLELLKKSDNLTDTLEIQDRLSEVRASLESYKGKLKALNGQIDYSTVTVYVDEVERVTPPEGKTFFEQVRANLSENLYSIAQGFRSFAIGLLSSLPYILLWLVLIGIVVLIVVRIVRKRRRR